MKNFLFLIGIVLIVTSCNQKKVPITLNGYDSTQAAKMVKTFLKKKGLFNRAARTNIWFRKEYLDSLVTMLDKERTADTNKIEKVDGIRIYFAKDSQGKYGFILVSTRGKDKDTVHKDYFKHDANFLHTAIAKGEIDHGKYKGAVLYSNYPCQIDNCNPNGKHYVNCSTARDWVNNDTTNAKNKKDTINSTSEWFELELLRDIKNDLNASSSNNRKPDGIRIYYTRKNKLEPKKPKLYRHHFVLVTTETVNGNIHQDYFDCLNKSNANDNGEQCRENCYGTSWADVKTDL